MPAVKCRAPVIIPVGTPFSTLAPASQLRLNRNIPLSESRLRLPLTLFLLDTRSSAQELYGTSVRRDTLPTRHRHKQAHYP